VLSGAAAPSFFRICRSSLVDRHVPTIEQCRWVLNSQTFVRRGGAAAGVNSPRSTNEGGSGASLIVFSGSAAKALISLRGHAAHLAATGQPG